MKVTDDLVANLFNPDRFMLQTAAAVIYRLDKEAYHTHTKRLKSNIKKELDKAIVPPVFKSDDEEFHQKLLLIERAIMLKQIEVFNDIPGVELVELASCFDEIKVANGIDIIEKGDSGASPIYIVLSGKLKVHDNGELVEEIDEKGIVGHNLIISSEINEYTVTTVQDSILLMLGKDELYDQVSKHIAMVDGILNIINEEKTETEFASIFN